MCVQSEEELELQLIENLKKYQYKYVEIKNEDELLLNLKQQLEIHNKTTFTDLEFERILNHLNKGDVFERAQILRDQFVLQRCDGTKKYIEFLQKNEWCQNQYQVTRQIMIDGKYKNRYDVSILVNGFPLVHIELKRRGIELKEAFNQINRYQRHSFSAGTGLFLYTQIYVISNGGNTKYFANNRGQSFKQTFYWTNRENERISKLEDFTKVFLEPCRLSKMVTKYIVLNQTDKMLMVLRPYQYYAVESIVDKVKNGQGNGYIWHTTGSGKTLTSFKTSQILKNNPKVKRIVFVVDRKDLDFHTQREFNSFAKGCVDASDNTEILVKQFNHPEDYKLIVTTIQKLNNAIGHKRYYSKMKKHKDEKTVFIFDECHRSQFGETHKRITNFFTNAQMFGFTGTPILGANCTRNKLGKRTTKDLFGERLHKYMITQAIRDENVLKFSIEYIGRYKKKNDRTFVDIKVEGIDKKELINSKKRLDKIVDYIIANHNRKTRSKEFTAMMCVSSVETLIKYYELFKSKNHNLKIATIFSYSTNENDKDANDDIYSEYSMPGDDDAQINQHSRDKLEAFIGDYNKMFNSKFTTKNSQSFYNYYNDIGKKVRERKIDILLVVNMFLTGFDSKPLNTIYVDKNLKHHGLIQAFSRTNRIKGETKTQGNIVCFRNLKKATDKAIKLFSDPKAKEIIIMDSYESYVKQFNNEFIELMKITPTVKSVDLLADEEQEASFIQQFRKLMRILNIMNSFINFNWDDLAMNKQLFADFSGKYLDLYQKVKGNHEKENVSILDDLDFELELIHKDEINVAYILRLLGKLKNSKDFDSDKQQIINTINNEPSLRSKRDLIQKFIEENLQTIEDESFISDAFDKFIGTESQTTILKICKEENLDELKLRKIISTYDYSRNKLIVDNVMQAYQGKSLGVLKKRPIGERIINKILKFVETFIDGI